jgi:glycosyltransferase involved in cell wall biosynthesis
LEALAAGTPFVMSDLPVLREIFQDTVLYAHDPESLASALQGSLDHPDPIRTATGRALAATHTWHAAARAHLALYENLPAGRPAARRPV